MLRVRDIMTSEPITVSPQTGVVEAAKILLENHINGVPVVDETGKLVGILCQSDLIAQQKRLRIPSFFRILDVFMPVAYTKHLEREVQKITATTVAQAMTPNPLTVRPDTSIAEVAIHMVDRNLHTLPVMDEGKLVGIVGKEDVLRTLMPGPEARKGKRSHPRGDVTL